MGKVPGLVSDSSLASGVVGVSTLQTMVAAWHFYDQIFAGNAIHAFAQTLLTVLGYEAGIIKLRYKIVSGRRRLGVMTAAAASAISRRSGRP